MLNNKRKKAVWWKRMSSRQRWGFFLSPAVIEQVWYVTLKPDGLQMHGEEKLG